MVDKSTQDGKANYIANKRNGKWELILEVRRSSKWYLLPLSATTFSCASRPAWLTWCYKQTLSSTLIECTKELGFKVANNYCTQKFTLEHVVLGCIDDASRVLRNVNYSVRDYQDYVEIKVAQSEVAKLAAKCTHQQTDEQHCTSTAPTKTSYILRLL
eukprot:1548821-Amphidinium_carterae.1